MSFRLVYGPTWAIQAGSGRALQATGQALAAGAGAAAEHVHQVGAQSGGALHRDAGHVAGHTADAVVVALERRLGVAFIKRSTVRLTV